MMTLIKDAQHIIKNKPNLKHQLEQSFLQLMPFLYNILLFHIFSVTFNIFRDFILFKAIFYNYCVSFLFEIIS